MDAEDVRSREQNLVRLCLVVRSGAMDILTWIFDATAPETCVQVRLMRVLRDKIAVQFFKFFTSKSEGAPEVGGARAR